MSESNINTEHEGQSSRSRWICIGVETSMPWPTEEVQCKYQGQTLVLLPETPDGQPTIAIKYGNSVSDQRAAMKRLRQFMTAVAWMQGHGLREDGWASAAKPVNAIKPRNSTTLTSGIDLDHLPLPETEKQSLALSLYRDALSNNSVPYKFLGLARIINMIKRKGNAQKKWINTNIAHIRNTSALNVIAKLRAANIDIGDHLYVSGRCAVAHAGQSPVVNPDSSEDLERMDEELPLIRALAEYAIENEFGVKSRQTIWKEHLYELSGFKKTIPGGILTEIFNSVVRQVGAEELNLIFDVGLRENAPFGPLSRMYVQQASIGNRCLQMALKTEKGFALIWLMLDFKNERLMFDPYVGMGINDDGSIDAALDGKCLYEFRRDLFANGSLQIKDTSTGDVLGYTSPFLATNIDVGKTIDNFNRIITAFENRINVNNVQT